MRLQGNAYPRMPLSAAKIPARTAGYLNQEMLNSLDAHRPLCVEVTLTFESIPGDRWL